MSFGGFGVGSSSRCEHGKVGFCVLEWVAVHEFSCERAELCVGQCVEVLGLRKGEQGCGFWNE